ncbi:MAG TPA: zinc ribbon domain-containing protein [Candidatus Dormibacteraeota bacterium]|nr:zinc ribbon domain-containing protein [Candidatus Dormibacteraeota bacterium]
MPVYGYRCTRGHQFEVQQRITEPPLTQCPECGAPVTRVFYPVGIIFKGGGFYKTDSRGSSSDGSITPAESPKADSKAGTKTDSTTDNKTDSKTKSAPDTGSSTPSTPPPAKTEEKTGT